MTGPNKLMCLLIVVVLAVLALPLSSQGAELAPSPLDPSKASRVEMDFPLGHTDLPPVPLPRDCDDVTPPGADPVACCAFGYVYYDGAPVSGATVKVESSSGTRTMTTGSGGASGEPYYQVDLSSAPLSAAAGSVITLTASISGTSAVRTWTVVNGSQQVDVGLQSQSSVVLFEDDFSTDKGWTNATSGHFVRDDTNDWLSWHIHRSTDEQYYMPIPRYSGDFRLEARLKATAWANNCNFYFGLADELKGSYLAAGEPIGLFVDFSWFGGFPERRTIRAYGTYSDTNRYIGVERIAYNMDAWYRIVFEVQGVDWTITVYDESEAQVGQTSNSFPSGHDGFDYVLLWSPDNGDWPTGDGLFDDLVVYGDAASVPNAAFSADPLSGNAPLDVALTDESTGDVAAWTWTLGDGTTSGARHPAHTYGAAGTYDASLTVSGPGGSDTETKTGYITVSSPPPPTAQFSADKTSGTEPLLVQFTDQSTGNANTWAWTFGDGGTSTAQNSSHTYSAGTYTVSLTVTGPGGSDTETKTDYITVPPSSTEKTWTFILYFAGDNNLHPYLERAIDNMEKVADKANLEIVALWDGWQSGDTRLYHVEYDTAKGIASPVVPVPWNPGEVNTGNSQTLVDFANWARTTYPSDHYMLSIANHGRGTTGIAWDDTSQGDKLSAYSELETALSAITGGGSAKIDLLFFDACLMGLVEDAYEVKAYVDYVVASENLGWSVFAYEQYAASVGDNTNPDQLAQSVADAYFAGLSGYPGTVSALDLSALDGVGAATDALAQALVAYLDATNVTSLITLRDNEVQTFDSRDYRTLNGSDEYVDLYHFAQLMKVNVNDAVVQSAAQGVMDAVDACVLAEHHQSGRDPWSGNYWDLDDAHGLAVYYPPRSSGWDYQNYVMGGSWGFCAATAWDDFLIEYFRMSGLPPETSSDPGMPLMQPLKHRVFLPLVVRGQ